MALVGSLVASLSANTTDFDRGMQNAQRQLTGVQQSVTKTQGSLSGLGTSFAALGASLVSLTALKTGLDAVIQSGDQMTRLTSAFTAVTGSQQGARESLEFVREAAQRLGVNFGELADAYKGVAAASKGTTLEGAATRDIFTAITNASRALQLSTQDTQGVLLAIQQIMSKGTVSAEELRGQIGERLPGAFNIAARAMGVTTAELGKLLESGQLLSTTFLPRFARQLQTELGDSAKNAAATFGQAMERLKNATGDVAAEVAKSGVVGWLTRVVDKLAEIIAKGPAAMRALENVAAAGAEAAGKKIAGGTAPMLPDEQRQLQDAQLKIEMARKLLETQEAANKTGLDRFLPAFLREGAVTRLREAITAAEKARDELMQRIEKGVVERSAATAPEFGTVPGRYAAAQEARKQIADIEAQVLASTEKIRERMKLGSTVKEQQDAWEEMAQITSKGIKQVQDILVTKGDPQTLLRRGGAGAIVRPATTGEGAQGGGTAFDALERLRVLQGQIDKVLEKPSQDAGMMREETERTAKILDMIQQQSEKLKPISTTALDETTRFIQKWEDQYGRMAEGSKRLLLANAALIDQQELRKQVEEDILKLREKQKESALQSFDTLTQQLDALDPKAVKRVLTDLFPEEIGSEFARVEIEPLTMQLKILPALKIALLQAKIAQDDFTKSQQENAAIQQTVEALESQTRALTMTREAQLELILIQNRATEGQRTYAKATLEANKVAEASSQVTSFLMSAFEDLAFRGEFNFRKLAQAFTEMVFKIIVQSAELDKSFTKLLAQGINLGLSLLGGAAGASSAAAAGTTGRAIDVPDVSGVAATSVVTRQHGGIVFPRVPTLVGESGPELILPTVPGVVLTNRQTQAALSAGISQVTFNIYAQDAPSVIQSRGAVSRAMINVIAQAQRNL